MDRAELHVGGQSGGTAPLSGEADVTVCIPTYNRSAMLRRAIETVLAQSYPNFVLIVSDNASEDETADVMRTFDDPRVVYRPLEVNIGRAANFNRLIALTQTEFILMLGDDDELHPDHLAEAIVPLKLHPKVGVSHTGYTIRDAFGNTLTPATRGKAGFTLLESGPDYLERSMREGPSLHISTTIFRKAALDRADGLRPEDGAIDDFPLLMRIATEWDVAYLNKPLATMAAHDGASSSSYGEFTPRGFRSKRALPDVLYEHRLGFLAEAGLPAIETRGLRRLAERSYRRDVLSHLSMRLRTGDGRGEILDALRTEIARNRRLAVDPLTWRFAAGVLGGRRIRDGLRSATASVPRRRQRPTSSY